MVTAGSKGNSNNIAQIMAGLGQQIVEGARVPVSLQHARTLTMFPPGAYSAAARGFVRRGYLDGMEPSEYFFHMMGGREGLVATAVKTADTGYKYRSMAKAMETNVVAWDLSVRNAQGYVIEFLVGGDGMDPTRVQRVHMGCLLLGNDALRAKCAGCPPKYQARVLELRDYLRTGVMTALYPECNCTMLLPLNIPDELARVAYDIAHAGEGGRPHFPTHPRATDGDFATAVLHLIDHLATLAPTREAIAALELAVLTECTPKALRAAGIQTVATFNATLAAEIAHRTQFAAAHPGDSVGVVAAESIGEPATQFTLNVFHSAGLLQRQLTVGVPRLNELLTALSDIRTPSMLLPFREGIAPEAMPKLAASIQFLCVDTVLTSSYPQYDPVGADPATMAKDGRLMAHVTSLYGLETGDRLSPWVLRLVLKRAVLEENGFTPRRWPRSSPHK